MYEVYSQLRPGRPRWTLGASAVVLLLSVLLAAGVSKYKSRALLIPLTPEQVFKRGNLKCALPTGWKLQPEGELPPGIVVSAQEAEEEGQGRQLFIFRDAPHPLGIPSDEGLESLQQLLGSLNLKDGLVPERAAEIGSLPGLNAMSVKVSRRGQIFCVSRVAVAPEGQVVGIVLAIPDEPSARDRGLVGQIAEHLQLLDVQLSDDTTELMKRAGIRFEPPSGAHLYTEAWPALSRIQMNGGDGADYWYLSIYRIPILKGRSPESLVRDFCLTTFETTEVPGKIATQEINGRPSAEIRLSLGSRKAESLLVSCVQTDGETGLMLIGRHESEGLGELSNAVQSIVTKAIVTPFSERFDLQKARQAASDWLDHVHTKGLKNTWGDDDRREAHYSLRCPALTLGAEARVLTAERKGRELTWNLRVELQLDRAGLRSADEWRMRDDGRMFQYTQTMAQAGRRIQYHETATGDGQVHRELSVGTAKVQDFDTKVDTDYVPEPLLLAAAGHLTTTSESGGMLFSGTDTFVAEPCHWVVMPMGPLPLPGGSARTASAVLIQRDYYPFPIILFYDRNATLEAVESYGGRYQIRTRQAGWGGATE